MAIAPLRLVTMLEHIDPDEITEEQREVAECFAHDHIKRIEYPVSYNEKYVFDPDDGLSCLSTDIVGGWDAEITWECVCGSEFYSREEAENHMQIMEFLGGNDYE